MEYGSLNVQRWYLSLRREGVITWVKLEKGGWKYIGGTIVSAYLEAAADTIEIPFSKGKATKPLAHHSAELVGVKHPLQQGVGSMV